MTGNITGRLMAIVVLLALTTCSQPGSETSEDCLPTTPASVEPTGDPNRRIEDIIEYLTGERQTSENEVSVEEKIDDPNFGGVWGDFQGGVVVAVLDCSEVDANRLAEIAGGSDSLHLIEVPYTFRQVDEFRDDLVLQLSELGVEGDVVIDSTIEGRKIAVRVEDLESLPRSFGAGIPDDIYELVEGAIFREQ